MNPSKYELQDEVSAMIGRFAADLSDPAKPLSLIVRFQVSEGAQELVEAAFATASEKTRHESGVLSFDLNMEARDATRFVVYERWKSLADLEAHLRTDYIAKLRMELDKLIVGTPEFHVLVPGDFCGLD
jgi:quinol monooxygenase YgiN